MSALQVTDREVTTEEGQNFAKMHGCLFVETSAKADVAVTQAFEELVLKVRIVGNSFVISVHMHLP